MSALNKVLSGSLKILSPLEAIFFCFYLIFKAFPLHYDSDFSFMFSLFFRIFSIILSTLLYTFFAEASSGDIGSRATLSGTEIRNTLEIFPSLFSQGEDTDIDVFTSRYIWLSDKSYIPPDLLGIEDLTYIEEAGRKSKLRKEAHDALWLIAKAFYKEFGEPLVVISGYRSAEYQQRMWDLGKCNATLCAPPGYSEHQLGLAIDIFDATTEEEYYKNAKNRRYIAWFQAHAYEYWWHQSYQNGEYIDAYEIEPWHWRYLWVPLATKLKKFDMSYTEYIRFERILAFWKR